MLQCSKRNASLYRAASSQEELMFVIYILSKIRGFKLDRQT